MINAKPLYFILATKGRLSKIIILTIQTIQGCDISTLSILNVELECNLRLLAHCFARALAQAIFSRLSCCLVDNKFLAVDIKTIDGRDAFLYVVVKNEISSLITGYPLVRMDSSSIAVKNG